MKCSVLIPTLYNDVLQLKLSTLSRDGWINEKPYNSCFYHWMIGEKERGCVGVEIYSFLEFKYVKLDYLYKGIKRNYQIKLISIPSNLGIGKVWYFLCPLTGKRCRKLYCVNGFFYHREAFTGCLYESQIYSKKYRRYDKYYGSYFKLDYLYQQLHKKYFKKYYRGKPTNRYSKIMNEMKTILSMSKRI